MQSGSFISKILQQTLYLHLLLLCKVFFIFLPWFFTYYHFQHFIFSVSLRSVYAMSALVFQTCFFSISPVFSNNFSTSLWENDHSITPPNFKTVKNNDMENWYDKRIGKRATKIRNRQRNQLSWVIGQAIGTGSKDIRHSLRLHWEIDKKELPES